MSPRALCYHLLLALTIFSCNPKNKNFQNQHSFYYWKSIFKVSEKEKDVYKKLDVSHLYLRLFDVAFDKHLKIIPHGDISIHDSLYLKQFEIIPCVFIANEVFTKISHEDIGLLAEKIGSRILNHCKANNFANINEIQLDCDWNKTTRGKYFEFLNKIEPILKYPLSVTIRLHQIKFFRTTGVPPVKKGVLMCYNVSPPQNYGPQNSIFDINLIKAYTKNIESYPLHLDIGLPIYSWGIIFRKKKFSGFLNGLTSHILKNDSMFSYAENNIFVCKESLRLNNNIIYKGDEIRVEEISEKGLVEVQNWFNYKLAYKFKFIYYHSDEQNITNHETFFNNNALLF